MIITITGEPGSGKSTVGKKLGEKLNYKHYYIGQIRRDAAKKKGMTLAEYNKYGELHPETDTEVDNYQRALGKKEDDFIIEGRTSWFLIPRSIKLYFKVDPREGARRVFNEIQGDSMRNEDNDLRSVGNVMKSHEKRMTSDKLRYQKYYQKDCYDEKNFDFVIDTTCLTPQEVFERTWKYIQSKVNNNAPPD